MRTMGEGSARGVEGEEKEPARENGRNEEEREVQMEMKRITGKDIRLSHLT